MAACLLSVWPVVKFSGLKVQVTGENTSEGRQLVIGSSRRPSLEKWGLIKIAKKISGFHSCFLISKDNRQERGRWGLGQFGKIDGFLMNAINLCQYKAKSISLQRSLSYQPNINNSIYNIISANTNNQITKK